MAAALDNLHREISVKTVGVVIKTLVVEKRQFTVAMLKQLPRAELRESAETRDNGTIWGYVLYAVDGGNRHLIFERNGRLYRESTQASWHSDSAALEDQIAHMRGELASLGDFDALQKLASAYGAPYLMDPAIYCRPVDAARARENDERIEGFRARLGRDLLLWIAQAEARRPDAAARDGAEQLFIAV